MPAPPPRAATGGIATTEEVHDGGAPLTDRKEKEGGGGGSNSSNTTAMRSNSSSSVKDHKKRDRARELEAALRAKDDRIADLEKELDIMEREFHKELDKLSQNESETATFWQEKHSKLNQQFLRTDTELRLLRAEVDVREAEREELREGWEMLRRELKERDDEIRGLRGQVRGLKEWVSTSTRTDGQTSDEVFGDGMTRLGNGLQNWVIVNFRKAKLCKLNTHTYTNTPTYRCIYENHIDLNYDGLIHEAKTGLAELDEATLAELNELVPMYEELASTAKVHLLQSIVSRILVEMVFEAYYVGLSDEQTEQFRQMENLLSSFG